MGYSKRTIYSIKEEIVKKVKAHAEAPSSRPRKNISQFDQSDRFSSIGGNQPGHDKTEKDSGLSKRVFPILQDDQPRKDKNKNFCPFLHGQKEITT